MIKIRLRNIPSYRSIAREVSRFENTNILITIIKMIIGRIHYGFSPKDYTFYNLGRKPFSIWNTYLSNENLRSVQNILNPRSLRDKIDNKINLHLRCLKFGLPNPNPLAIICGDRDSIGKFPQNIPIIYDHKMLFDFINSDKIPNDLIIKLVKGGYSRGLISLTLKPQGIFNALNQPVSLDQVRNNCFIEYKNKSFIVQERLKPSKDMKSLMPGLAMGCIRLVTHYSDPNVSVLFGFIKIPIGNNITDAFKHGDTGNLISDIDLTTGKLGIARGKKPDQYTHLISEFHRHPTTGVVFQDFQIPQWEHILKTAKQGAKAFPELRLIGWDIVLSEDGIYLLEGNTLWDADAIQVTLEKGIKKEIMSLV